MDPPYPDTTTNPTNLPTNKYGTSSTSWPNQPNRNLSATTKRLHHNMNDIPTAPRELWVIFVLKLFSSYAYFAFAVRLVTLPIDKLGLSDMEGG